MGIAAVDRQKVKKVFSVIVGVPFRCMSWKIVWNIWKGLSPGPRKPV